LVCLICTCGVGCVRVLVDVFIALVDTLVGAFVDGLPHVQLIRGRESAAGLDLHHDPVDGACRCVFNGDTRD